MFCVIFFDACCYIYVFYLINSTFEVVHGYTIYLLQKDDALLLYSDSYMDGPQSLSHEAYPTRSIAKHQNVQFYVGRKWEK
jgi:hypothetical protein